MAIMHAGNNGVKWVSDVSKNGWGFSAARNNAVETTLAAVESGQERIDYIVWVDSDIVLEPNTLTKLVWTAANSGFDFFTGVYHQKNEEAKPVIYDFQNKWWPLPVRFNACVSYPPDRIAPIGGCGFGICITSVKMLQYMKASRHWEEIGKWFPDTRDIKGGSGEDLNFCKLAIQCGYQLYVHTGIQVGHHGGSRIFTREDFDGNRIEKIREAREEV